MDAGIPGIVHVYEFRRPFTGNSVDGLVRTERDRRRLPSPGNTSEVGLGNGFPALIK